MNGAACGSPPGQEQDGGGAEVIDGLARDLHEAFPDQRGFSRRNLQHVRAFAAAWPEPDSQRPVVHQPGARLPWRHVTVLLDRLDTPDLRARYATAAAEHGWSRNVLEHQTTTSLHARAGAAPSNSAAHLALRPGGAVLRFLAADRPWERADVVVAGTPVIPLRSHEVAISLPGRAGTATGPPPTPTT